LNYGVVETGANVEKKAHVFFSEGRK